MILFHFIYFVADVCHKARRGVVDRGARELVVESICL